MGVIAVLGPTASGKSSLAMAVARELEGEIVSVDSMQVYRGLDIGTAKPTVADQGEIPHHLIDVADPEQTFTVANHQELGVAAIDDIESRGRLPVVVGGSGLHFRSLVDPLEFPPSDPGVRAEVEALEPSDAVIALLREDPEAGMAVDLANPRRVARALEITKLTGVLPSTRVRTPQAAAVKNYESRIPLIAIGLDPEDATADRVQSRFDAMLAAGLLDEVSALADTLGVTASQGVGYKELLPVVRGEQELASGRDAALRATMALVKRQRTFFRRDPRIKWIQWHDDPARMATDAISAIESAREEAAWTS